MQDHPVLLQNWRISFQRRPALEQHPDISVQRKEMLKQYRLKPGRFSLVRISQMTKTPSLPEMIVSLRRTVAFHQEREAFHGQQEAHFAQQAKLHGEERRAPLPAHQPRGASRMS